jgi:hypothetical protein
VKQAACFSAVRFPTVGCYQLSATAQWGDGSRFEHIAQLLGQKDTGCPGWRAACGKRLWHNATAHFCGGAMPNHAVALRVTPCLSIECKFWLDDNGWNGSAEAVAVSIQADSFAQAKADMELALGKHLESLLRERHAASPAAA